MIGHPPVSENPPPSADDIAGRLDRLEARLDAAERRIDAALTPEPVDWHAHYRDVLSEAAAAGRRVGALAEGGA